MLKDSKSEAIEHFTKHEGRVNHLYLDTAGLVTVGIGCQVFVPFSPASCGQWIERGTGSAPAYSAMVHADYDSVRRMKPGMVAEFYAQACMTRLTEESIDNLFMERLSKVENELARRIFDYEKIPNPAQFALLDMGFNLGVGKLIIEFPNFMDAIRLRQFARAAKESARAGDAWAERNAWTAEKLMEAESA